MKPFYITTPDGQELAVYTKGNRDKPVILFIHGGPGGCIDEHVWSFFDLDQWYVVAFDQRGCGLSKPFATLINNTPEYSVQDIEHIRTELNIKEWTLFGGSYGTTLALRYAQEYPKSVVRLILRGVFLGRDSDIQWLYQEGASYFYPKQHEAFKNFIEPEKQKDLVAAYYEQLTQGTPDQVRTAAKNWSDWESSVVRVMPSFEHYELPISQRDISIALLECHYFVNHMFWDKDSKIMDSIVSIKNIETIIVHGRYDVNCRPEGAYELAKNLDNCRCIFVEGGGHTPYEESMFKTLQQILASF